MIIMGIMIVLTGTVITNYLYTEEKAREVKVQQDMDNIARAIENYRTVHGVYPNEVSDLVAAGFMKEEPISPWGRNYILDGYYIICPGPNTPPDIIYKGNKTVTYYRDPGGTPLSVDEIGLFSRKHYNKVVFEYSFPGKTIDTDLWSISGNIVQNNCMLMRAPTNSATLKVYFPSNIKPLESTNFMVIVGYSVPNVVSGSSWASISVGDMEIIKKSCSDTTFSYNLNGWDTAKWGPVPPGRDIVRITRNGDIIEVEINTEIHSRFERIFDPVPCSLGDEPLQLVLKGSAPSVDSPVIFDHVLLSQ